MFFFFHPVLKLYFLVPYSPYIKGQLNQSRLQLSHAYKRIFDGNHKRYFVSYVSVPIALIANNDS